jgi:hypothetical protein
VLAEMDTYRDLLGTALDVQVFYSFTRLGHIMKRLTAVTVIIMVPNFVASVYGMNSRAPRAAGRMEARIRDRRRDARRHGRLGLPFTRAFFAGSERGEKAEQRGERHDHRRAHGAPQQGSRRRPRVPARRDRIAPTSTRGAAG